MSPRRPPPGPAEEDVRQLTNEGLVDGLLEARAACRSYEDMYRFIGRSREELRARAFGEVEECGRPAREPEYRRRLDRLAAIEAEIARRRLSVAMVGVAKVIAGR